MFNFFRKPHLSAIELEQIKNAIVAAEKNTSGEIRVYIENKCKGNVLERAVNRFYKLKMEKTQKKNAVLIYLAKADHKLAIIGDEGINKVVPENFWNDEKEILTEHFTHNQIAEGLCKVILQIGEQLKHYFPFENNDRNELNNDVVMR